MSLPDPKEMARAVTEDLFTDGSGGKAERLVLLGPEDKQVPGWGRTPVKDQITAALIRAMQAMREEAALRMVDYGEGRWGLTIARKRSVLIGELIGRIRAIQIPGEEEQVKP